MAESSVSVGVTGSNDDDARAAAALLKSTQHVVFWVDRRDTQVPAKEPIDWECPYELSSTP